MRNIEERALAAAIGTMRGRSFTKGRLTRSRLWRCFPILGSTGRRRFDLSFLFLHFDGGAARFWQRHMLAGDNLAGLGRLRFALAVLFFDVDGGGLWFWQRPLLCGPALPQVGRPPLSFYLLVFV